MPLRHRSTRLLEAAGIDSHWHVDGVDGIELGGARSLDLLRLLQEALTNVFRHSGAGRVDVDVTRRGERLHVRRLGGTLRVQAGAAGGTDIALDFPVRDAAAR